MKCPGLISLDCSHCSSVTEASLLFLAHSKIHDLKITIKQKNGNYFYFNYFKFQLIFILFYLFIFNKFPFLFTWRNSR